MQHQSLDIRKRLTPLLLKIMEGERQIEILRQALCEQDTFEPYAAFKRIEHSTKGAISASDILKFLTENKITHIEEFCAAFLQRYDLDFDHKLRYPEFLAAVLPTNNPVLRSLATQRANYNLGKDQDLPYQVEYALTRVLDKEISFYSTINPLKVSLSIVPGFTHVDAFALLDIGGVGLVSLSSLKDYFRDEGIYPNDEDLKAILRRLDKDNDGFVKFEEFVEGIKPYDPKSNYTTGTGIRTSPILSAKKRTDNVSPLRETLKKEKEKEKENQETEPILVSSFYQNTRSRLLSQTTTSPNKPNQPTSALKSGPLSSSGKIYSSPLASTSKYGQKLYSERARKIIEQTVSPIRVNNSKSPLRKRLENDELIQKHADTISPKRYNRDSSLKRTNLTQSELPKSYNKNRSPLRDYLRKEDKSAIDEPKRDFARSETKAKSPNKQREEKQKTKGVDSLQDRNYRTIVETLKQFVLLDKEIETAKRELDLQMDFNLLDVFKTFDLGFKGAIRSQEIMGAMKQYGVYPDQEELYLFMRRFDKNGTEELSFGDFSNIFRLKQHDTFDLMTKRTPKNPDEKIINKEKLFTDETRKLVAKVLRLHLENERASERLRQNLKKKQILDLREVFKRIDKADDGFITTRKFKKCLEENGIYIIDKEVDFLMERFDLNGDGKVSYVEFLQELTPKCK